MLSGFWLWVIRWTSLSFLLPESANWDQIYHFQFRQHKQPLGKRAQILKDYIGILTVSVSGLVKLRLRRPIELGFSGWKWLQLNKKSYFRNSDSGSQGEDWMEDYPLNTRSKNGTLRVGRTRFGPRVGRLLISGEGLKRWRLRGHINYSRFTILPS